MEKIIKFLFNDIYTADSIYKSKIVKEGMNLNIFVSTQDEKVNIC